MASQKSGSTCIRFLLIIFNLLFLLAGLTICGFAIYTLIWPNLMASYISSSLVKITAYILLTFGGITVLIAFLGFLGASLENRCALILFFTLLCGIFLAFLVSGILIAIFKSDLEQIFKKKFKNVILEKYGEPNAWTDIINILQENLQCCGVENGQVQLYMKSNWFKKLKSGQQRYKRSAQNNYDNNDMRYETNNVYNEYEESRYREPNYNDRRRYYDQPTYDDRRQPVDNDYNYQPSQVTDPYDNRPRNEPENTYVSENNYARNDDSLSQGIVKIPLSCCTKANGGYINSDQCQKGSIEALQNQFYHNQGCTNKLSKWIEKNGAYLLLGVIGTGLLLFFGMLLTLLLLRRIVLHEYVNLYSTEYL